MSHKLVDTVPSIHLDILSHVILNPLVAEMYEILPEIVVSQDKNTTEICMETDVTSSNLNIWSLNNNQARETVSHHEKNVCLDVPQNAQNGRPIQLSNGIKETYMYTMGALKGSNQRSVSSYTLDEAKTNENGTNSEFNQKHFSAYEDIMDESSPISEDKTLAYDNFPPEVKSRYGSRAMSLYEMTQEEDGDISSQDSQPPEKLSSTEFRTLSQYEMNMERDIKELRVKPINTLQRLRRKGRELLNSKGVLLAVVILNCVDCILVLSELLLDVYLVKKMIDTTENTMEEFNSRLMKKYPKQFAGVFVHDTHHFYNQILRAHLVWNISELTTVCVSGKTGFNNASAALKSLGFPNETDQHTTYFENADDPEFLEDHTLSIEEKISHTFHEISIVLLSVLVIYTLLKIFCHGLSFLKHKLQVFDCIVVLSSFGLDVGYMKGLTNYPVENFILVLAIMIPWRIFRVLNSLVIAVKGKFHFLLKLMHTRNKLQKDELKFLERENRSNQKVIESLRLLCSVHCIAVENALMMTDRTDRTVRKKTENLFTACAQRQDSLHPSECMSAPYLMANHAVSPSVFTHFRSRYHDDHPTGSRYGSGDVEMPSRTRLLSSKISKDESSF